MVSDIVLLLEVIFFDSVFSERTTTSGHHIGDAYEEERTILPIVSSLKVGSKKRNKCIWTDTAVFGSDFEIEC